MSGTPPTIDASSFPHPVDRSSCVFSIPCNSMPTYQYMWGNDYNYFDACLSQYTVSVSTNNTDYGSVTGGGIYFYNEEVTITATPTNCYFFTRCQDGSTANPRHLTVTADATYMAYFTADVGIADAADNGMSLTATAGRIVITGADGHGVTLTDILGRILYRGTATGTLTVDVPATGIYLLQVEGQAARRVAVVR